MLASAHATPLNVVTPLNYRHWHDALAQCSLLTQFADVPTGIRDGFKTGVSSSISAPIIPQNHSSALVNPHIVSQHIANELQLHRYSGPFQVSQLLTLIGPFRTAPLGVVPKPNSDKFRVIQDLSFPRNDPATLSVNSEINSADFPCEWGTFAQCYFLIAKAPPPARKSLFSTSTARIAIFQFIPTTKHTSVWHGKITFILITVLPSVLRALRVCLAELLTASLPSSRLMVPSKCSNGLTISYSSDIRPLHAFHIIIPMMLLSYSIPPIISVFLLRSRLRKTYHGNDK